MLGQSSTAFMHCSAQSTSPPLQRWMDQEWFVERALMRPVLLTLVPVARKPRGIIAHPRDNDDHLSLFVSLHCSSDSSASIDISSSPRKSLSCFVLDASMDLSP